MTQSLCSVSYVVPETDGIKRSGTITGDHIVLTGVAGVAQPGVTITKNQLTITGDYADNAIEFNGNGELQAKASNGDKLACTATSNSKFVRP